MHISFFSQLFLREMQIAPDSTNIASKLGR
jgi:hypothetical protein